MKRLRRSLRMDGPHFQHNPSYPIYCSCCRKLVGLFWFMDDERIRCQTCFYEWETDQQKGYESKVQTKLVRESSALDEWKARLGNTRVRRVIEALERSDR